MQGVFWYWNEVTMPNVMKKSWGWLGGAEFSKWILKPSYFNYWIDSAREEGFEIEWDYWFSVRLCRSSCKTCLLFICIIWRKFVKRGADTDWGFGQLIYTRYTHSLSLSRAHSLLSLTHVCIYFMYIASNDICMCNLFLVVDLGYILIQCFFFFFSEGWRRTKGNM